MRAKHRFGVRRYSMSGQDRNGNVADSWGDPEQALAYSIGPRYSTEADGSMALIGLVLGIPSSYNITEKDLIRLDGNDWAVDGVLVNANRGPWGYRPGWILNIRRAT